MCPQNSCSDFLSSEWWIWGECFYNKSCSSCNSPLKWLIERRCSSNVTPVTGVQRLHKFVRLFRISLEIFDFPDIILLNCLFWRIMVPTKAMRYKNSSRMMYTTHSTRLLLRLIRGYEEGTRVRNIEIFTYIFSRNLVRTAIYYKIIQQKIVPLEISFKIMYSRHAVAVIRISEITYLL